MSTRRPLQTQISPELYQLLQDLADIEKKSVAQYTRELLEQLEPGLRHVKDMEMLTRSMNEDARKALVPDLERHGQQLEGNVKYVLENMERTIKKSKKDQDPPQHKLPL